MLRAVLLDQRINLSVPSRPASLFNRRVGFRGAFQVFALNPLDATAFDKDIERAAPVPDTGGRFIGAVGFHARATGQMDPHRLGWWIGLRQSLDDQRLWRFAEYDPA